MSLGLYCTRCDRKYYPVSQWNSYSPCCSARGTERLVADIVDTAIDVAVAYVVADVVTDLASSVVDSFLD